MRGIISKSFLMMVGVALLMVPPVLAQRVDADKLMDLTHDFTVIVDMKVEFSFGMQTAEHEQQMLGTIVTEDGLVMFYGGMLAETDPLAPASSFSFKATPTEITITTLDEAEYSAEFIGVDRDTKIAFAQIVDVDEKLAPVKFVEHAKFQVGDQMIALSLLPDWVSPRLTVEQGVLSALIEKPEEFATLNGFDRLEFATVVFDEKLRPIGVLGALDNPNGGGMMGDAMGMGEGMSEMTLLGVYKAEKVTGLIAEPPVKGQEDRAWLGIAMQALTEDLAGFLSIDAPGGVIINDVVDGSPAENAGMQMGDVIVGINGQPVEIDRDDELSIFQRRISSMGVGASVEFEVLRPTDSSVDTLTLLADLDVMPLAASEAAEFESEDLEFKVRDMVYADYARLGVRQGALSGVVVSELNSGGLASIGGLQLGDVVQQVNDQVVNSVDEMDAVFERVKTEQPSEVVFLVWRDSRTLFVNVKTDWPAN